MNHNKENDFLTTGERRSYPRINCNLRCKFEVRIMCQKVLFFSNGYITNINGGGLFLRNKSCVYQVNIGDSVDIEFNLLSDINGEAHNIYAKGGVVRKTYNGFGMKLMHIEEKHKDLIMKLRVLKKSLFQHSHPEERPQGIQLT